MEEIKKPCCDYIECKSKIYAVVWDDPISGKIKLAAGPLEAREVTAQNLKLFCLGHEFGNHGVGNGDVFDWSNAEKSAELCIIVPPYPTK